MIHLRVLFRIIESCDIITKIAKRASISKIHFIELENWSLKRWFESSETNYSIRVQNGVSWEHYSWWTYQGLEIIKFQICFFLRCLPHFNLISPFKFYANGFQGFWKPQSKLRSLKINSQKFRQSRLRAFPQNLISKRWKWLTGLEYWTIGLGKGVENTHFYEFMKVCLRLGFPKRRFWDKSE